MTRVRTQPRFGSRVGVAWYGAVGEGGDLGLCGCDGVTGNACHSGAGGGAGAATGLAFVARAQALRGEGFLCASTPVAPAPVRRIGCRT